MYLNEINKLTKLALDIYPEPSLKSGGIKKDYKKRWAEYYVVAKTLLKCYDNPDTDPFDIFDKESLQYSIMRAWTESYEKKKLYTVYINALDSISLLKYDL